MKRFLFIGFLVLIVFLLIPVTMLEKKDNHEGNSIITSDSLISLTPDETINEYNILSADDITYIATNASNFLNEKDSIELKKAVLTICKNNYLYYQINNKVPDKLKVSNYSDELFDELSEMINEIKISLIYEDEIVYIPILRYSGTYTGTSKEYPYMVSVASPWEVLGEDFTRFADYPCGVSVSGMSFLAKAGLEAKEMLWWYLPEFTIK